ncbi:MAG TPA: hypothetical protein VEO54_12055 [Thermoanaerobaculia bacterium]|nr:hypothetical protein [Thermoanaerobaculia bacterium]
MARLLAIVTALAVLLGAAALAVHALEDRELMVPPPDAVAEAFVREVVTGRYARAREYLAEPLPDQELRTLRQSLGEDPTEVEAEVVARNDRQALANVRVSGGQGSAAVAFALEFEEEWKIVR